MDIVKLECNWCGLTAAGTSATMAQSELLASQHTKTGHGSLTLLQEFAQLGALSYSKTPGSRMISLLPSSSSV